LPIRVWTSWYSPIPANWQTRSSGAIQNISDISFLPKNFIAYIDINYNTDFKAGTIDGWNVQNIINGVIAQVRKVDDNPIIPPGIILFNAEANLPVGWKYPTGIVYSTLSMIFNVPKNTFIMRE
jgi:hypothetical protein